MYVTQYIYYIIYLENTLQIVTNAKYTIYGKYVLNVLSKKMKIEYTVENVYAEEKKEGCLVEKKNKIKANV